MRPLVCALAVLLITVPPARAAPSEYLLPGDAVFPEGIATRPDSNQFFVTSTADGTIFRGFLSRKRTEVFLAPGGQGRTNAVGLKATADRLIVAGGDTNTVFVYSLPEGQLVRRFSTGSGGLVNDVAITPGGGAYVTDSTRGLLFRLPAWTLRRPSHAITSLRPFVRLTDSPTGAFSNGVVAAGRRYLLVAGTDTGALVRVDRRTKRVRRVDLGGAEIPGADGLARAGRTLYVVNSASRVTALKMSKSWLRASLEGQITSPRFRFPTTAAVSGGRLLVVNSQFNARGAMPVLPFNVSALAR